MIYIKLNQGMHATYPIKRYLVKKADLDMYTSSF